MSHRFSYPSLMGPNLDAKPSELPNSDVALSEYDDGYNNAGLDVCNEFAEVANRELINRELVNLENAVVNIDNSNDVIIGPVTQFNVNGNVTIYQNKDGQPVEIEEKPDISTPAYTDIDFVYNTYNPYRVNEKLPPKIKESYKKAITWTCCSIIVIIVMCATLIFIKLLLLRTHKEIFGVSNRSVENKMFNSAPNVFCRHQWGGVPPKNPTPFTFPIELVVIKETGGRFCEIEEVCKELTLKIQTLHMTTMNYSDIGYNFLVGGDGNIYVGRGFGVQNVNMRRSIDIAIHGNFYFDQYYDYMQNVTKIILDTGVELGYLAQNYSLVCHNQTELGIVSPGRNVYKVVSNWTDYHYDSNTYFNKQL
ncbi:peptidoglycan-recognition protein LE-like isoform X3 [Diabrotica undecimpunctata]|uniref:peptidoglycan-recognition protein LE-like isoform X3 n=1 Tax=Diabrotica undecimpunctata TaxID=50387 RepID=UPI003B634E53